MNETAMRNADGDAVFVTEYGEYTDTFPSEQIVREATSENIKLIVRGYVGTNSDFEDQEFICESDSEAIRKATELYGTRNAEQFTRTGEVFKVEINEIDAERLSENT